MLSVKRKGDAHIGLHLLRLVSVEEDFGLFICLHLCGRSRLEVEEESRTGRTNNFLFTHPSSNAGNSTPFNRVIARMAPSGS